MESKKSEYRILIKNFVKLNYSRTRIHQLLKEIFGSEAPTPSTIRRWVKRFESGETSVEDRPRPGQPRVGRSVTNTAIVNELITEDRRYTIKELAQLAAIPMTTVWRILTISLCLILKCAKWVPKILTSDQEKARVKASKENLYLNNLDPDFFQGQIVTGDETYIHHYDPTTKRESMQWLPHGSARPEKAIRKLSAKKVMALVFWDRLGV